MTDSAIKIVHMLLDRVDDPSYCLDVASLDQMSEDEISFIESYGYRVVLNKQKSTGIVTAYTIYHKELRDGS